MVNPFDHGTDEYAAWERQEAAEQAAAAAKKADLLADLRSGAWLDAQTFAPLQFVVPGLFPEGFSILIGPPKAGKSWLILGTLLAVASGGVALGHLKTGAPRRVLYLALEDGDRRMQDRCRALLDGSPIPDLFHYFTTVPPARVLDVIRAFLDRYGDTALVVLDTLGKVMPPAVPGESAYGRDYRIGGWLKRISDDRPGLAVIVLHHDRKASSEDFVDAVSGTNGIAGSADTIIVLARARQSTDGLLKITGRDVVEAEYALQIVDGTWTLDGATLAEAAQRAQERVENAGLSATSTDILGFVRAAGPAGVKAAVVAERFGKDAYQYLRRQVEAGRLAKAGRGLYVAPESVRTVRSDGGDAAGVRSSVRTGVRNQAAVTSTSDSSDGSDMGLWWPDEEPPEDR